MRKIYKWELPQDQPDFTGYDDLPEAYRVFEDDKCAGGIIVEARWHGKWEANPWNIRTLIRHLLLELKPANPPEQAVEAEAESRCPKCSESEPVLCCEHCGHKWSRTA